MGAILATRTPPTASPPVDDSFWTVFTATEPSGEGSAFVGAGTRKIYVSTSGSDANPGTLASPKLTLDAGVNLLRDGKPDWLLLKKGDTWTQERISFNDKSGVSEAAPMLIGAYGTGARPKIQNSGSLECIYLGFDGTVDFIAVVGLELYAYKRDPSNPSYSSANDDDTNQGFVYQTNGTRLLLEDLKVSFFPNNNISLVGTLTTAKCRRCVVLNAWGVSSHSIGIYADYATTPTIIECILDHNGYNETVGPGSDAFSRNVYLRQQSSPPVSGTGPAVCTGNWISRSSTEGLQLRSGGTLTGNFFWGNSSGFDVGHQIDDDASVTITTATANDNVVMRSSTASGAGRQGYGIVILNATGSGIQVRRNIITKWDSGTDARAFYLDAQTANCVVQNNIIFDYIDPGTENGIHDLGTTNAISSNNIDIPGTNNNPGGLAPSEPFPAPDRELGDYYASIGGPNSATAFITAICAQSKDTWNPLLTATAALNYIRAGFNLSPV